MSNFKIKVHVEIVECDEKNGEAPEQQDDGSFTMIINEKDATSIDSSEKALLKTSYPAKRKISRLHIRITDAGNNYLHKAGTTISKNHAVVVLEDLRIRNMSASARGTMEEPGRNVRAKAGLNKAIPD